MEDEKTVDFTCDRPYETNGGMMFAAVGSTTPTGVELYDREGALVSAATTMNNVTLNESTVMYVYKKGVANDLYCDCGTAYVSSGGTINRATADANGCICIQSDGKTVEVTLQNGGLMKIFDGGAAEGTSIKYSVLYASGGTISDTTLQERGRAYVSSGVVANRTRVGSLGELYVSGGTDNDSVIGKNGWVGVFNGGVANRTAVESDGLLEVSSGGTANDAMINGYGSMSVDNGGLAKNTAVNAHGLMKIFAGGEADNVTVNGNGRVYVSAGGKASIRENGGEVYPDDTADVTFIANSFTGSFGGWATLHSGTTAYNADLEGRFYVYSGGLAESVAVNNNGQLNVYTGGTANNTAVNAYGYLTVSEGGVAQDTSVNAYGYLTVSGGGTANNTRVNESGCIYLRGGTANHSVIDKAAAVYVYEDSLADGVVVNTGGTFSVSKGGTAKNITIKHNSIVQINGTVAGTLDSSEGGCSLDGATLDFTVAEQTVPGSALVNNWRYIDFKDVSYTLTITPYQASGNYVLAQSIFVFDDAISVYDTAGKEYGTLSLDRELDYNNFHFSLRLEDETLSLAVTNNDTTPPVITLVADTVTVAQSVTLAAATDDGSPIEYSLDRENWEPYERVITVAENGTWYFRSTDTAGNTGVNQISFTNIDNEPPEKPEATADVTTPTENEVVVTARFSSDSVVKEYSFDRKSWEDYEGGITFRENGNVYFRAADAAGNVSEVTTYAVTNIYTANDDWTDMKINGPDGDVRKLGVLTPSTKFADEVGKDDPQDYLAFTLESAAKLSFNVSSWNAIKFSVNELTGSYGKYKLKAKQSVSVKVDSSMQTAGVLLNAGTYYIGVVNSNKKAEDAAYDFEVSSKSIFYTEGDNSDDWTDVKTSGAAGLDADLGTVAAPGELWDGWVGFGDAVDYTAFTLDRTASLVFDVDSSDAVKFSVFELTGTPGKYKLKKLQTTSLKANEEKQTKALLLKQGTYYLGMESTNAKKGGSASYDVALSGKTEFYKAGDNSDDTWKQAQLQSAMEIGDEVNDWVGFGDKADFWKFELKESGSLAFDLDEVTMFAVKDKELKLSCVDSAGKSVALYQLDADTCCSKKELASGTYYLGVTCANEKKYNTSYGIKLGVLASA